jgi:spore germination cell wall hydrolase CwlJ-like protein
MFNKVTGVIIFSGLALFSAIAQSSTFQNPIEGELYSEKDDPEVYCMAINIYHEARADNLAGQFAVADVVLNRVKDIRYPNTICEVVKQGAVKESWKTKQDSTLAPDQRQYNPIRNKCQFSWWCDGKDDTTHDIEAWRQSQDIAEKMVYIGMYRGITEGATHYHATYVSPRWAPTLDQVGRIGSHTFYRWQ